MVRSRSFGERVGVVPPPNLRIDDVSYELKVAIWNNIADWIFSEGGYRLWPVRARVVYDHLGWPIDEVPTYPSDALARLKKWLFDVNLPWFELYGFVEIIPFVADLNFKASDIQRKWRNSIDDLLEQHGAHVRFLNGELTQITNEQELSEIRLALGSPEKYRTASETIANAISHFNKKPEAAYTDCIKEAMSAVESVLWVSVGQKGDIPPSLRLFEKQYGPIHPAMRLAIEKLYGYASDEQGVRHGATEPTTVRQAEARFILVTCSAIVNFLIQRAQPT